MTQTSIDWSDFSLPIILPELSITPTYMQVFMFSAATWNRHHIHYSRDAAVAEGLPDVVVQRALIGNYFARLLTDWLGNGGEIKNISWKVLSSAIPNRNLRFQGIVTGHDGTPDANNLLCEMTMIDESGETLAVGSATVCVQEIS